MNEQQPKFEELTEDEFRKAFIEAANGPREGANHFFNQFRYVHDLFHGNPSSSLNSGIDILNKCRAIDSAAYTQIHKGSAYYWLGIAAFLVHDHELATFFFDAAVGEDIRAGCDPIKNTTPAFRFIQVEGEPREQAARPLVQVTQARIQELIDDYNGRPGVTSQLDFVELRRRFLRPAVTVGNENLRSLATAFISFCLEWDFRNMLIDLRPSQGTAEPFFLHLFKGCVLFESILKCNPSNPLPPAANTLGMVLRHLYMQLGIPRDINIGGMDFPTILANLPTANESIQTAIQFTGFVRNTVGHNLGWVVTMNKIDYSRLFRMVSTSCFHSIVCLYN